MQKRSLYRRHRPRTFDDVVGQESVVRTLRNAVERDAVHHAYLFVGSRGTGKTSMAKILAACLNCERGRSTAPCGVCASCEAIAEATSLDVAEMDAASNNSVEDIRELRESVAFQPVSGRTKVYILDEAHMLTSAAWNAFLKTLEEPPPDTVFVLATTEAQKVPATVVDRCHRFDFQRPSIDQLIAVLRRTAQAESISIEPEAIAVLARAAGGSFRDALGTLEQLLTYAGREIGLEDALAVLGVADTQLVERAIDAVAAGDSREALLAVQACVDGGREVGVFVVDMERRARELMVVQALGEVPREMALGEELNARLTEQAQRIGQAAVVRLLEALAGALQAAKAGADARTQLELALVKAARPELEPSVKGLMARMERLERGAPGAGAQPPAGGTRMGETTAAEPPAASVVAGPGRGGEPAGAARAAAGQAAGAEAAAPGVVVGATPSAGTEAAAPGVDGQAAGTEPSAPGAAAAEVESIRELWPAVIDLVRNENALIGAVIEVAAPVALDGSRLTVAFPAGSSFNKRKAEDSAYRNAVAAALQSLIGRRLELVYELSEEVTGPDGEPLGGDEAEMVAKIMAEFDAQELAEQPEPAAGAPGTQRQEGGQ